MLRSLHQTQSNRYFLLYMVLLLLFFWKPLIRLQPYYGTDLFDHVPAKLWMADQLKHGTVPLWNPYHSCGIPMAADDFTWGIYYPGMLFHILFPGGFGFTLEAITHLILAFYFTRKLTLYHSGSETGAFLGGTAFTLGSAMTGILYAGDSSILYAACWLPAVFYYGSRLAKEGKSSSALALVLALQVFGGHPEIIFFTALFSFLFILLEGRIFWRRGLIAHLLPLGITAIHLLPVIEVYLSHSMRNEYWSYESSDDQSFPISFVFSLLSPGLFGRQQDGTYWGPPFDYLLDKYIGILPLFFAVGAILSWKRQSRFVKLLLAGAVISFFISFGNQSGFSQIANSLPIVGTFSVPSNMMIFAAFFLSLVAALNWNTGRARQILLALLCLSVAGWLFIYFEFFVFPESFHHVSTEIRQHTALAATAFSCLIILGLFISSFLHYRNTFWLALHIFSLVFFASTWVQPTPFETYISAEKWRLLKRDHGFFRIFEHLSLPFPDKLTIAQNLSFGTHDAMYFGISQLQGGTTTLSLLRYHEYKAFVNFRSRPVKDKHFFLTGIDSPLLKYANVKYLASLIPINHPQWRFIGKTTFYHYEHVAPGARVRIFSRAFVEPDPMKMLFRMEQQEVLFLETAQKGYETGQEEGSVRILSYRPNEILLEASVPSGGYLFLSEVFFPGWKATIDGRLTTIQRANHTFRAVDLPPGKHNIRMWYRPASWIYGCVISAFSVFLLFLWIRKEQNALVNINDTEVTKSF